MKLYNKPDNHWLQINYRHLSSLLGVQFVFDLYDQFVPSINVHRYRNVTMYYEDGKMWSYAPKEDWKFNQYWLSERFKELEPDLITEIEFYVNREKNALKRFLDRINETDLESLDAETLAKILNEWYYTTLNDIFALNLAPVEHALTETIKELLSELVDDNQVSELLSILLTFEQYTEAAKEDMALTKLALDILEGGEDKGKLLFEHTVAYSHLTLGYGSKAWTYQEFEVRVNSLLNLTKYQLEHKLDHMLNHPNRVKEGKERILSQLNNDHIRRLAELGAGIGYLRDKNKALLGKSVSYRNRIIRAISEKTEVSAEDMNLYFLHEIMDLLLNNIRVSNYELSERQSGIILNARLEYLTGDEARLYRHKTFDEETFSIETIKGLCASPGELSGKVRICHNPNDCNALSEGEILVAHGTDFDYIDAMMKASAIITEEGGMLSHAAVVSREMGKPCIVGMKGILSCLNNGDEVVLNAIKGTVKVISQSSNVGINSVTTESSKEWETYFNELSESGLDLQKIGGKAYNLSNLINKGILVPEGIVANNSLFYRILMYNGKETVFSQLIENSEVLKPKAMEDLIFSLDFPVGLSKQLEKYTHAFGSNTTFAVRSSGIDEDGISESFAGIHHTSLYCGTVDEIEKAIKRCWSSFYGSWSMVYRERRVSVSKNDLFIGGVIIQKMVDADLAGVLFTANPISGSFNEIVIESCKGVANKLVNGSVTPCTYILSKTDQEIISQKEVNTSGSISPRELKEFSLIVQKLEAMYPYPLDVEWAIKDQLLYIIQARPITTLQVSHS